MLPFGHIAAGYLVADIFFHFVKTNFSPVQIDWLVGLCTFAGFAPDLDMFYGFWKERGFHQTGEQGNHRQYITHTPLPWLALAACVAVFGQTDFWHFAGLMIWFGSWTHFLLDSTDVGVRWLYPFSQRFFALKNPGRPEPNTAQGFFPHWANLLKQYWRRTPLTVCAEIVLIVVAIGVFMLSGAVR